VIHIYVDGGTRGNQVCLVDGNTKIVKQRKGRLTNNELEYLAVIYGLQYISNNYHDVAIQLHSDSKLIVNHLRGIWRVRSPDLFLLHVKAHRLLKNSKVVLKWVPRNFNLAGVYLDVLWDK